MQLLAIAAPGLIELAVAQISVAQIRLPTCYTPSGLKQPECEPGRSFGSQSDERWNVVIEWPSESPTSLKDYKCQFVCRQVRQFEIELHAASQRGKTFVRIGCSEDQREVGQRDALHRFAAVDEDLAFVECKVERRLKLWLEFVD